MTQEQFMLRVLGAIASADAHDFLWYRTDGEYAPIRFFINCNDLFFWACADAEDVTPENVEELERAIRDYQGATGEKGYASFAPILFCCRVRQMRPQGAYYEHLPKETWPLFDACGPERPAEFGNPKVRPGD